MCEKPKPEGDADEKEILEKDKSSGSDLRKDRGYYYDDAHGYEVFKPCEEDDGDE